MLTTRTIKPKEKAFADNLLQTNNGADSVRRAFKEEIERGELKDNPIALSVKGHRLLKNVNVANYLKQKSFLAGETMVSLLESKQDSIKFQSAKDILDRTIGKASDNINLKTDTASINIGSVNLLMQALQHNNTPIIEDKGHLKGNTEEDRGGREGA